MGSFIYEDNKLQYILHEEGRCRPQTNNTVASVPAFDYDYFLKDHLGNVRTVINAQAAGLGPVLNSHNYTANMEVALAATESLIWSHLDDTRENKPGSINPSDTKAAELNGADPNKRIGVALLLKAMPGDQFDLSAQTYYDAISNDDAAGPQDVATSLLNALSGGTNYAGVPVSEMPLNVRTINNTIKNPAFADALDALTQENYDNSKPAAFLNYVVFDQKFNVVKENSGVLQVGGVGGQWNTMATNGPITINQPGYIAVFASSKTASPAFFDKIDLTWYKGNVLEENHYYPFGLTLSVPDAPDPNEKNNYKLATKELQDDLKLNWYDFGGRMQDEQIGRWMSVDPKAEKNYATSGFVYANNNPVIFIDPDGNQNMVYLFNLPNSGYSNKEVTSIINRTNQAFGDLGLNMQIKQF